ncbi:hypothetical protein BDF22DRAFT_750894 [Syncephalis plumigaleata]|nr:hypothetical protein BDF22DRAFT_750894 [Syncephalis plumigaleata]
MESFLRLILLSIGMFVGALLAGILPFRLGLAENRHNLTTQRWTVFGSGLLVGTVLIVILPEGMEAVYGGSDNHHHESDVVPTLLGIRWHSWIGPVLAWGFSFMFLVDQRPHYQNYADVSAFGIGIFAAVLLHKAPAAFGLSTVLLREGYTRLQVLHRLLAFAIAAPLGALLTYGVLVASFMAAGVYGDKQELATDQIVRLNRLTGLLLLFSAGTFLYVATAHALPDTLTLLKGGAGHHQHHHSFSNTFNTDSNELIYSNEE